MGVKGTGFRIASNISPRNVLNISAAELAEMGRSAPPEGVELYTVRGKATGVHGYVSRNPNIKDGEGLSGQFVATTTNGSGYVMSAICYLPGAAGKLLCEQVKMMAREADAQPLEFAATVRILKDAASTVGYRYSVEIQGAVTMESLGFDEPESE